MPKGTKIGTCCYCGSRTLLKLTARDGHELACASCGAPIHEMKALKKSDSHEVKRSRPQPSPYVDYVHGPPRHHAKRKQKRRKPMWKKAFEEAFDLVEDIFD
ncbi:hypothetical protein GTA62_01435 [Roseobacter sp. HKCCD9010]|jgi:DNA-directed RNA polymerase subunit RPC12/RpoP|uniref:hypothetical protein n=1 Tax=Rhodobacterales TaxID=204455 RepID=UPI00119C2243|nr:MULTISPECIES: hypothetical protein [Rhodobacterales]MBF9049474.1 hypothetical protein [Rhodobacterales bacterium HKCCD4356]NNV11474.1 hypothetical protein [Roseobacter sp. HKCCD7357]NNV15658.1 hypothetical protein [Roseobacter sp. HKCCD8768]NNV25118.1 hypothetical protein [Roseobacter sp. HKCCD8192]NNV29375.1 hypothetical protein [Roseobacter sp. HKCCD9061]